LNLYLFNLDSRYPKIFGHRRQRWFLVSIVTKFLAQRIYRPHFPSVICQAMAIETQSWFWFFNIRVCFIFFFVVTGQALNKEMSWLLIEFSFNQDYRCQRFSRNTEPKSNVMMP
jgi:hypothetical protein